jgi:hypothetical protein
MITDAATTLPGSASEILGATYEFLSAAGFVCAVAYLRPLERDCASTSYQAGD